MTNEPEFVLGFATEAGAANLLFPYLKATYKNVQILATEPAKSIANSLNLNLSSLDQLRKHSNLFKKIYIGGSLEDKLDFHAELLAYLSKNDLEKICVFDNWVNYEKRFPREIVNKVLVFDYFAKKEVEALYPHAKVIIGTNYLLINIKETIAKIPTKSNTGILLFDTRENTYTNYVGGIHGKFCLCSTIDKLNMNFPLYNITYRKHPGGEISPCVYQRNDNSKDITISKSSLAEDFSKTSIAVGNPTYALYVAHELGMSVGFINTPNSNWVGPSFPHLDDLKL